MGRLTNSEVADKWAECKRSAGGNMSSTTYGNGCICYSYSTPIARMFEYKGETVSVMFDGPDTNTTAHHKSHMRHAVGKRHIPLYILPCVGYSRCHYYIHDEKKFTDLCVKEIVDSLKGGHKNQAEMYRRRCYAETAIKFRNGALSGELKLKQLKEVAETGWCSDFDKICRL